MEQRAIELLRRIMNKTPIADPFSETFSPTTDSLEAIRDAITGLETGIYTYAAKFGAVAVELNDGGTWGTELLNPGDVVIPAGSITPGQYKIERIRDNVVTEIVALTAASKGDGRIFCTYQFTAALGWAIGDLFRITFTGGSVTIGTVTTAFPDNFFYGRIVRDEFIQGELANGVYGLSKLNDDLDTIITRIGDPTGHTLASLVAKFGNNPETLTAILGAFAADETGNLSDRIAWLQQFIAKGTGTAIGANLSIIDLFGAFDGGIDAQGDIFQAIDPPADGHGIMTVMGKDDEDATKATWDTDHWEGTVLSREQKLLQALIKGTGGEIGANLSIIDIIGAFDGAADPQGSIFRALGVGATYSIWDAVQYITHAAILADPIAGSIVDILAEDIWERANTKNLNGLLGVPDAAGKSLYGNMGDFMANLNLQTLKAILAVPDTAGKGLFVELATDRIGAVGDAAAEAGTLLPRLKFYGEGIIKGTGTAIPANKSLYDAIGLVLARANNPSLYGMLGVPDTALYTLWGNLGAFQARANLPSLLTVLGLPDDANGSFYQRLGAFTTVENLKAILGNLSTSKRLGQTLGDFTETDTLKACLGAFDSVNPLKAHTDYIITTPIPAGGLTPKVMVYYLQAIGSNDINNDFDSSLVVANPDGSVLERLEDLKVILDDKVTNGTHSIEVAHGVAEQSILIFTPNRVGDVEIQFDVQTLIAAVEGGTVTVRLKHMIDNATRRTVDLDTFIVGTDEVHPSLRARLDSNNVNGAQITIQCSVVVTAPRTIPYKIMEAA